MKRKLLLSILAAVPAVFLPLTGNSQFLHIHKHAEAPATQAETPHKYEVFAGYGYSNISMVDSSHRGLQGVNLSVTRDFGKYFGITADGAFYAYPLVHPVIRNTNGANPVKLDPTLDAVFLGPVLHAQLFSHYEGFFRVLLGGEHVGGVNAYPDLSFAGGFGAGLDYKVNRHFAVRASGDDIISSFVAPIYPDGTPGVTCTTTSGCSPHEHKSARAAFGVVYKF